MVVWCLALAAHVHAQNFPEKAVTLVVASTPGGSTDAVARTLAQRLSEIWGHPAVVVNRAGADGRMHSAIVESLRTPRVKEVLGNMGAELVGNTPDQFAQELRDETAKWIKVMKASAEKLE